MRSALSPIGIREFWLVLIWLAPFQAVAGSPGDDFFESKIRPVLVEHCYSCHSTEASSPKGGLRLDTRDQMRAGGESGAAVVPGDIEGSLLIAAIRYENTEMPPDGKLDNRIIEDFVKWIELGASDPREEPSVPPGTSVTKKEINWAEAAKHWAFQSPQSVPCVPLPIDLKTSSPKIAEWAKTRVDEFVLEGMLQAGLEPNDPADRRTLIRRLSFDIIGLPPSFADAEQFHTDEAPDAVERVVERVLGSVQYGEKWARLWLDIVRYAEDQAHIVGDNKELFYPNAYRYRDWVIDAFNADMPYDEFCRLQLAADLIAPEDDTHYVALGMIGLGPKYYRRGAPEVMADEWEDRVDTVSRGLLGLTVACARCHDHKYDPIPTDDYYAMAGVFASTDMFNRPVKMPVEQPTDEKPDDKGDIESKDKKKSDDPEKSIHIIREAKPRDLNVMIRGDVANIGELVPRGFLSILGGGERMAFATGSGRLELANAIVSPSNPLTARVIVNRVWGELLGEPLVSTQSNFGALGTKPTHQALLDDLAVRFMDNKWSLKWLIREILCSSTYQQSSHTSSQQYAVDPANRWLSRANRKRLSAELWRDSMLAAGGSLDWSVGGTSVVPSDPNATRRTIYSVVSRFQLDPFLSLMDFPDPNAHSEGRNETTTPIQKLFSLNSDFIVEQSRRLTSRVIDQPDRSFRDRIDSIYQIVFSRSPDNQEVELATAYFSDRSTSSSQWTKYAQVLLASNELLIVD